MESFSTALQQLIYDFLAFLPSLVTALIIFIGSSYLAGLLSKVITRSLEKRGTDSGFILLLVKVARYTLISFGAFTALQQIGFNLSAFLTGLGILGFTLGFALQDVSKNFVSGLLLLLEQPFDKGDMVRVSDQIGIVGKIELRTTEILTFDGQNVIVPNGDVFNNSIKNYSRYRRRRMDTTVTVAYGSDLDLVRQTALEVAESVHGAVSKPRSFVAFRELGDFGIRLTLYCWVDVDKIDYFAAKDALVVGVDTAFREKGIQIATPMQRVLLEK